MPTDSPRPWTLLVHGGAGILTHETVSTETDAAARDGLDAALAAGEAVLASGGAALDAVEAAVRVLEDDPTFNSGRGAVFTFDGAIELDAAIMDGRDRSAGAVAGVTGTRHPVTLARAVKDHSPHVLLSGKGADTFGPCRRRDLDRGRHRQALGPDWRLAVDRGGYLCRRPRLRDVGDRVGRVLHPGGRGP